MFKQRLKSVGAKGGKAASILPALCLVIVSALLAGCEPQVYGTVLDHRGERAYLPDTDTPYTGVADVYYKDTGGIYLRTPYKNGFLDGFAQWWYQNGQLASERTYKGGKIYGLDTWWYDNGQKRWEILYENGKQHGRARYWDKDGTQQPDVCWQRGEQVAMNQCGG